MGKTGAGGHDDRRERGGIALGLAIEGHEETTVHCYENEDNEEPISEMIQTTGPPPHSRPLTAAC